MPVDSFASSVSVLLNVRVLVEDEDLVNPRVSVPIEEVNPIVRSK
jgi:hypothetical protein